MRHADPWRALKRRVDSRGDPGILRVAADDDEADVGNQGARKSHRPILDDARAAWQRRAATTRPPQSVMYNLARMKTSNRAKRATHARDLALAFLGATNASDVRLKSIVDRHIERVLDATDRNLSLAAKLLGMHRRSLQRIERRKRPARRRSKK
jgi:hypothetical protein